MTPNREHLSMLRRSEAFAEDLVDAPSSGAPRRWHLGRALLVAFPAGVSLIAAAWVVFAGSV